MKSPKLYLCLEDNCLGIHITKKDGKTSRAIFGFGISLNKKGEKILTNHWHILPLRAKNSVKEFFECLEEIKSDPKENSRSKPNAYGPYNLRLKPCHEERFQKILLKLTPENKHQELLEAQPKNPEK